MDRFKDRSRRQRSAAEIEAVSHIADCLLDLERRERLDDGQILLLAQAIDALELGAFEAAAPLTDQARFPPPADPTARPDRAHAHIQAMALRHLRAKFMRLAFSIDPDIRW